MKNKTIRINAILFLVFLMMGLASCEKIDIPIEQEIIDVTSVIRSTPQNDSNHVTKIRFCLKNNTSKTLYYCKVTIRIVDDSNDHVHEVFRKTFEVGNVNNYNWTLAPYETQWSNFYSTDFYVFGDGGFDATVEDMLFY